MFSPRSITLVCTAFIAGAHAHNVCGRGTQLVDGKCELAKGRLTSEEGTMSMSVGGASLHLVSGYGAGGHFSASMEWAALSADKLARGTSTSLLIHGINLEGPEVAYQNPGLANAFICTFLDLDATATVNRTQAHVGKLVRGADAETGNFYYDVACPVPAADLFHSQVLIAWRGTANHSITYTGPPDGDLFEISEIWTAFHVEEDTHHLIVHGEGFFKGGNYVCVMHDARSVEKSTVGVAESSTLIDCGDRPVFPELTDTAELVVELSLSDEGSGKVIAHSDDAKTSVAVNTCQDNRQGHLETDENCGGPYCEKCEGGKSCNANSDCIYDRCVGVSFNTKGTCVDDIDGDGYAGEEDCDETHVGVNIGAAEIRDGLDNDCDGQGVDGAYDGSELTESEYEFTSLGGHQLNIGSSTTNPITVFVLEDVVISGNLDLGGGDGSASHGWCNNWAPGGRGGYAGGYKGGRGQRCSNGQGSSENGQGPGGGKYGHYNSAGGVGGAAGHVEAGADGEQYRYNCDSSWMPGGKGGPAYGELKDLTAGSGGGGGGGAIAIDANSITVTGTIDVSGGRGAQNPRYNNYNSNGQCNHDGGPGGGGSGGTIWLRAKEEITIQGTLDARGGKGGPKCHYNAGHRGCIPEGPQGSRGKILYSPRKAFPSVQPEVTTPGGTVQPSPDVLNSP